MVDRLTPQRRSWLMSRVRGKNTAPEVRVRKAAHALGLRFRLHRATLPGKPDVVFPRLQTALFVHGCFWHRHRNCHKATPPSSEFWATKFATNVARDIRVTAQLKALGWKVATIWECETKDPERLSHIVRERILGIDKGTKRKRPKRTSKTKRRL